MLFTILMLFSLNNCAVKRAPVQPGTIPRLAVPNPGDVEFGENLFKELCENYKLDSSNQKQDELLEIFNHITKAAEVDHLPWQLYIFRGSEIIDVRAVHGNYIFVWSGFLDSVENEDEIAGLLAWELAHVLAHHTDPVEFTLASEIFLNVTELTTSLALMALSQGIVAISGQGWMKWGYVEVTDLDPLDRKYSEEHEREAAAIALLIISRTKYSPQALLNFWKRVAQSDTLQRKIKRLNRDLTPRERVAMLEDLVLELQDSEKRLAEHREE
jgi:predicted Zn-dependent protease